LELVALAKKGFHRLGREVAVTSADIHDEGVRSGSLARERLTQPAINGLPDEMLDDSPRRQRLSDDSHYETESVSF